MARLLALLLLAAASSGCVSLEACYAAEDRACTACSIAADGYWRDVIETGRRRRP